MRAKVHRGRFYDAPSKLESSDECRGVFDVDSSGSELSDRVINEATADTYPAQEATEEAADAASVRWINAELKDA